MDTLYDSPFDVDLHCGQIRDVLTFTWRSHRPDPAPHVTWSKVRAFRRNRTLSTAHYTWRSCSKCTTKRSQHSICTPSRIGSLPSSIRWSQTFALQFCRSSACGGRHRDASRLGSALTVSQSDHAPDSTTCAQRPCFISDRTAVLTRTVLYCTVLAWHPDVGLYSKVVGHHQCCVHACAAQNRGQIQIFRRLRFRPRC